MERAKRDAEVEKRRAAEAAEEEAEEARLEEERRIAEEERRKKEHEEYLQLKAQFDVEEEGYDANQSAQEAQDQLNKFIEYIKLNKVLVKNMMQPKYDSKTLNFSTRAELALS